MSTAYQTPEADLNAGGMITCKACSKEIHSSASMCPHCGAPRRSRGYKSKNIAAVFAFFFGGFGVHRFYLGQWWGIFYLLFFWLWIPQIISFIEFIYFLARDSRKWDEKYNEGIPAGPNDKGSGAAIAIVVVLGGLIVVSIIGILAAVSIPAYHDYTLRAQVGSALSQAQPLKASVERYYSGNGYFPTNNAEIGLPYPYLLSENSTVTITNDGINIEFSQKVEGLELKTIVLSPDESGSTIYWSCSGGTLEDRYRPTSCR